jgi:hypothetical protein
MRKGIIGIVAGFVFGTVLAGGLAFAITPTTGNTQAPAAQSSGVAKAATTAAHSLDATGSGGGLTGVAHEVGDAVRLAVRAQVRQHEGAGTPHRATSMRQTRQHRDTPHHATTSSGTSHGGTHHASSGASSSAGHHSQGGPGCN